MKFWLAIDDTDDATKSIGTGKIAQIILKELEGKGAVMQYGVTRHQLLLDPAIPYTSHNSSMCMEGDCSLDADTVWKTAIQICMEYRSESSNPGICLYFPKDETDFPALIHFGRKAKKEVISISQAQNLADQTDNLYLEAPAGNQDGIIGALAGVGLRLSGNDGTFQGKKKISGLGEAFQVDQMIRTLGISFILNDEGDKLPPDAKVRVKEYVKIIYYQFSRAAAAELQPDGVYDICPLAFEYEQKFRSDKRRGFCDGFIWDNDANEQWSEQEGLCENCRHRRLVKDGFCCSLGRAVDAEKSCI